MQRISTSTKAVDLFGSGKHGFKDGNPALGVMATALNAELFNSVQEELCNVIEAAGITLDVANKTQLLSAINALIADNTLLVGSIIPFAAASLPPRYLPCNGASLLISAYPDLYSVIGNSWGAVDGTHFNAPLINVNETVAQGGTVGTQTNGVIPAHTHSTQYFLTNTTAQSGSDAPNLWTLAQPLASGSYGTGTKNLPAGALVQFIVKYI